MENYFSGKSLSKKKKKRQRQRERQRYTCRCTDNKRWMELVSFFFFFVLCERKGWNKLEIHYSQTYLGKHQVGPLCRPLFPPPSPHTNTTTSSAGALPNFCQSSGPVHHYFKAFFTR